MQPFSWHSLQAAQKRVAELRKQPGGLVIGVFYDPLVEKDGRPDEARCGSKCAILSSGWIPATDARGRCFGHLVQLLG